MHRTSLCVTSILVLMLVAAAAAQTAAVPDRPGRYLLTRQFTIPERQPASDAGVVADMRAAADREAEGWWIAASSVTGDLRQLTTFTFYESYAGLERELLATRGVGAAGFASHASLAVLRDDLSINPDKVPPSAARYWAVTTMVLKAGHMSDFAERTTLEIDLLKKAGLDHQFLVYQVLVGVPSSGSVFYVITPIRALADMDVDDSAKAAPVFTAEVRRRLETLNQQMISGIESDVLLVRPDLSRPPASYVAANAGFWTAKPTKKAP